MKKHFTILLASLLMFSLIAGCIMNGNSNNTISNISENVSEPLEVDSFSDEDSQAAATPDNAAAEIPKVYMTTDISSEGLMAVYEALGRNVTGDVAVKISTGEPGGHNYLSPD